MYSFANRYSTAAAPGILEHRGAHPDMAFVPLGGLFAPPFFTLWIGLPDLDNPEFEVRMEFHVVDGQALARSIESSTHEVDEALRRLLQAGPLEHWKREALTALAAKTPPPAWFEDRWIDDHALEPRSEEIGQVVRTMALRRARNRITDKLLREVASGYREAWSAGLHPTKAVASRLGVSHSTAARYVGLARKAGLLGPADGSKGGEVVKS